MADTNNKQDGTRQRPMSSAFLPWLMSRPVNELGKSLSEDIRTVGDFMVELNRDADSA